MADTVWIVEMTVAIPGTVGETTLRYATRGFCTRPSETPASTYIDDVVKVPTNVSRTLFSAGTTAGRSRMGYGDVVLNNADGALDGLLAYGFDGRTITIRRGTFGAAYPSGYTTTFVGTMEQPEVSGDTLTIKVRDNQRSLDQPFQPTKYAGDNVLPNGLEGVEGDLKGKPKPVCLGTVKNVPAVCVNTSKLIYQVSDGAVARVDAVYDAGVALGDGRVWEESSIAFGAYAINAAAYGNGLWLVAGENGQLFTSTDRETWTSRTSGFGTDTINGMCYGNSLYVAVGNAGKLCTSVNGTSSWTSQTSSFGSDGIVCVTYSERLGLYVAGSATGKIATSPDGAAWTQQSPTQFGGSEIVYSIIEAREILVAVGEGPRITTSPDGVTWTERFLGVPGSNDLRSVAFLDFVEPDGLFVACGVPIGTAEQVFLTSVDGFIWERLSSPFGGSNGGLAMAAGANKAVVVSGGVLMASTVAGFIWTTRVDDTGAALLCVATDGVDFLAAGTSGTGVVVRTVQRPYASIGELTDDAFAPMAGEAIPLLAGGYIRLGAPPLGQITADVTQGASAANRTAGQLFAAVLQRAGKASGDWSASDVTALDAANSSVLGFWTDEETTYAEVLDQIANSVGAWWGVDRAGVFRIKQFTAPAGTPVATFTADDLLRPLARVTANDDSRGLPTWLTTLRYQRNYTVQTDGVAGAVSSDRRAYLATEYREATVRDTAVLALHQLAPSDIQETLLQVAADATTEATRQQVLRGILRHQYELVVPLDDDTQSLDLGDVIQLTHNRYGLSGGALFRIIGVTPDAGAPLPSVTLRVWGPSDPTSLLRTPALRLAGAGTVS